MKILTLGRQPSIQSEPSIKTVREPVTVDLIVTFFESYMVGKERMR